MSFRQLLFERGIARFHQYGAVRENDGRNALVTPAHLFHVGAGLFILLDVMPDVRNVVPTQHLLGAQAVGAPVRAVYLNLLHKQPLLTFYQK